MSNETKTATAKLPTSVEVAELRGRVAVLAEVSRVVRGLVDDGFNAEIVLDRLSQWLTLQNFTVTAQQQEWVRLLASASNALKGSMKL